MTYSTKLRLVGGGILILNLLLIGHYDLQGLPVLLLTFGFAVGYEYLIVRRMSQPHKEDTTAPADDQPLYDKAILEIRGRSVVRAVWAQAFAEGGGDQRRTMARYITLRVTQLKAEQQATPEKPPEKTPWWLRMLQVIGISLLMRLIGLLPGLLTVLAYVWIKRKFGARNALIGSTALGICLTVAASMLLPKDVRLSRPGFTASSPSVPAHSNPPNPPNPFDQFDPTTASPVNEPPPPPQR